MNPVQQRYRGGSLMDAFRTVSRKKEKNNNLQARHSQARGGVRRGTGKVIMALLPFVIALSVTSGGNSAQSISATSAVTVSSTSLNGPGNVFLTANLVRTGGIGNFGASPSVVVADFNGDGKPDLAVADAGANAVSVLLGNGDGTFQAPIDTTTTGFGSQSYVAAGDFNGDGKADLAVIGGPTVAILLGNGNGTFTTKFPFSSFSNPQSVVLGDFNGDTKLDMAVVDAGSNSLLVFLGNGDGTFQAPITTSGLSTGFGAKFAAPADFNKDGKLDLVISDGDSGHVVVLLGNGDGHFQAARSFPFAAGSGGFDVAVGDFNGDGIPDIAATSRQGGVVNIFLGKGDGNFQTAVSFNASLPNCGPTNLAVADFNKDGKLDIITSLQCSTVSVLFGKGDGTFSAPLHLAANEFPAQLALADFNGDGNLDWVAGSASQMFLTVVLGNGNGTFQDAVNYAVGTTPAVALGDFNRDGLLDLVTINPNSGNIGVLLGKGDGTFQPSINTSVPGAFFGIAVADFNNDGNLDVVVGSSVGPFPRNVNVLLGKGDGTFAAPVGYSTGGSSAGSIVVADFNGDGKLDIAVVNQSDNTISLLLGNGDGTFQAGKVVTPALASDGFLGVLVAADLNRDGKMDLAIPDFCGLNCGRLAILLGNGDGTFQAPTILNTDAGSTGLVAADLNKDGKLDLAVANQLGTVDVLLGNGDGTFNTPIILSAVTCPSSATCPGGGFQSHLVVVAAADFNLDGNLDLVVGGFIQDQGNPGSFFSNVNLGFQLFLGNGNGTFTGPQDYLAGVASNSMAVGDFNRDGAPDLAAGDSTENFVTVLLNLTPPTVSVLPKGLTFGNQRVGTSSATQAITVKNNDTTATTIGVAVSGDFTQTNTCPVSPATLGPGASCTANVAFKPSATGPRSGTITITYNLPGSPQIVSLTGTGVAPAVTLSGTSVSFGNQPLGTSSTAQVVGLSNTGTDTLTITSITVTGTNSGDFSQTNTCGGSVAPGANCTISVTFKPTATGNRAASVTITDDASGSPQSVALTGAGTDFSLAAAAGANCPSGGNCSTSAVISAGQTAMYDLQVSPVSGFNGTVALTCTGAPSPSSCAVSPTSVPPNGSSSYAFTVSVSNTASAIVAPWQTIPGQPSLPWLRFVLPLLSAILALLLARRLFAAGRPVRILVPAMAALLLSLIYFSGCGGGGGGGGGGGPKPPTNATLTITGSSSGLNRTVSLSLTINH